MLQTTDHRTDGTVRLQKNMYESTLPWVRAYMLFILLFVVAACDMYANTDVTLRSPAGQTAIFHVEVAETDEERRRGLMGRRSLPAGTGMLFIFPEEGQHTFWMKDTLLPLDILFFDRERVLVSWARMEPCSGDPCPTAVPEAPARYVLEVPAGTVVRHGIGPGWHLEGPPSS